MITQTLKLKGLLYLFIAGLLFTSCGDDDSDLDPDPVVETKLVGVITSNKTLTADKIWEISGRVVVADGATLTIEAGTILKAFAGSGSQASTLIIARGGKIDAQGTETKPIIMTSTSDNIAVGQISGTNLNENDRGLWGGLLILGRAPGSFKADVSEFQIEGIPTSDTNGLYGGNNASDNSGTIKYISIRHGGALIGEGNEINGLTLGAVGNGTTIDHVEVVGNVDDGIEFFGGTVNASNLLVWACGDDGLDIDQAYSGTITNSMVILGEASDHGLEIDGPEGSLTGKFTLNGITLIGNLDTDKGEYADYRSKAMGASNNIFAKGFKEGSDVELDNNGVAQNFLDGKLTFSNWEIIGANNTIFKEKVGCAQNCDDEDESNDINEEKIILSPDFTDRATNWTTEVTGNGTVGADTSVFSWTFASINSAF